MLNLNYPSFASKRQKGPYNNLYGPFLVVFILLKDQKVGNAKN